MLFYGTMKELSDFLACRGADLQLDEAALRLARVEFPDLDIAPSLKILDDYAAELARRLGQGAAFVPAANRYLFDELKFVGNQSDYYDPANSCLNEVLARKTGIPITLSVVYMEVARRLDKPLFGIGFPGHFLLQYDDGLYSTYIDPFHGGKLLDEADCYELAGSEPNPAMLARVCKRTIVARMILNLRGIYMRRGAHRKLLRILNLQLESFGESAEEYRLRGITHLQLEQIRPAKADFERYLELGPEAEDKEQVETQLSALRAWMGGMN